MLILITCNVRGFRPDKHRVIRNLILKADAACRTETRFEIDPNYDWDCVNCNPTVAEGNVQRRHVVVLLYKYAIPLCRATTYPNEYFHCIHSMLGGNPILACYVRPTIAQHEFAQFLQIAKHCLTGTGVLLGELNARHHSLDDYTNQHVRMLHKGAQRHNFLTRFPSTPTCTIAIGRSLVDIVLHCGPVHPSIVTLLPSPHPHHRPLQAQLTMCLLQHYRPVPISLINNDALCDIASDRYRSEIPYIIESLKNFSMPASLAINSRRLAHATLTHG